MSFLSFLGSSFTTTHVISQIYRSHDFNNFMKNLNDKDTSAEVLETFVKNYILKQSDSYVIQHLNATENLNIFKNQEMSRIEQSKLFFGKMLKQWLDDINLENIVHMLQVFIHITFGISLTGATFEGNQDLKKAVIKEMISSLDNYPKLNDATSPTDVYRIIIEVFAKGISKEISDILHNIIMPMHTQMNPDTMLPSICNAMGKFNSYYEYQSKIYENDEEDNHSSSNSTSLTNVDDDDDAEDDGEEAPRNLKRRDAMMNVEDELLKEESDRKKQKKDEK
jgi:hypothetical protein